jgi:hypothetical protein
MTSFVIDAGGNVGESQAAYSFVKQDYFLVSYMTGYQRTDLDKRVLDSLKK